MTKEELISHIGDIEWEDFEVKEAKGGLPRSIWETVSAFSNCSGGWIILGVRQIGQRFEIQGVNNIEKLEQDFFSSLRSQKFNTPLFAKPYKYNIDGKDILAFYIPSSSVKPIYIGNPQNTYVRMGSGDQQATDMEISALFRDQAFGFKSEQVIEETSFDDIDPESFYTYRRTVSDFNSSFSYNKLSDTEFCTKLGILYNGHLNYGSLLFLGKRDSVRRWCPNFWVDYLEIPGKSYRDAKVRYTYRVPEQDNIWQAYQVLYQRLRIYADNPFIEHAGGFGPEDESQLYSLREGLINFLSHSDYFSPMHPTIRVYEDRIEFQSPGKFGIPVPTKGSRVQSAPRNPSIIRFFRYPRLAENAGYGIDKIYEWERLTGFNVEFYSELTFSTTTFYRTIIARNKEKEDLSTNILEKLQLNKLDLNIIQLLQEDPKLTYKQMSIQLNKTIETIRVHVKDLQELGIIVRKGSRKSGEWEINFGSHDI